MALSTTTVQPVSDLPATSVSHGAAGSLFATLLLTVYAAQSSKKQLRKLKRQAVVALFKYKMQASFARVKSFFSIKKIEGISDATLLYILLGLLVLILVITSSWEVAVIVLLVGILLLLLRCS